MRFFPMGCIHLRWRWLTMRGYSLRYEFCGTALVEASAMTGRRAWSTGSVARAVARTIRTGATRAVVNTTAYAVSRLDVQGLSAATGGLVRAAVAHGTNLYHSHVQSPVIRLVLPRGEIAIHLNTAVQQDALRMFFQASTHVVRAHDGGDRQLRTHLTSLHTLLAMYRKSMRSELTPQLPAKGDPIQSLALTIIIHELRPFLAHWHPRLAAFEREHFGCDETDWEQYAVFLESLGTLQRSLRPYVIGLGEIAGVPDPARHLKHSGW